MSGVTYLYAGTRDGLAVYRVNSGDPPIRLRHSLAGMTINAIMVTDTDTLVVAVAGATPLQSFDGGQHWAEAAGTAPEPIGLQVATASGRAQLHHPRLSGATAYALLRGSPPTLIGAGAGGMMIFLSTDDGIHWQAAQIDPGAGRVTALLPDPSRRDLAWAGTDTGALLRSGDRGQRWWVVAHEPSPVICLAAI